MLEITVSADKNRNNALTQAIFGRNCNVGALFILLLDDKDIGVMEAKLPPDACCILAVGLLPAFRKQGYADFFTRAVLSRMAQLSDTVTINYVSAYYHRFGFRQCGQQMTAQSKDIIFPHDCCRN